MLALNQRPPHRNADPEIFADRDRRYADLVGVIIDATGPMHHPGIAGT